MRLESAGRHFTSFLTRGYPGVKMPRSGVWSRFEDLGICIFKILSGLANGMIHVRVRVQSFMGS